mmetsp:Transcript_10629/g.21040  ORF Transcript_10629/g.21040 Transcript_10629/m.21040 type:complete len:286 (-) Transcript_10629:585-1442(-)
MSLRGTLRGAIALRPPSSSGRSLSILLKAEPLKAPRVTGRTISLPSLPRLTVILTLSLGLKVSIALPRSPGPDTLAPLMATITSPSSAFFPSPCRLMPTMPAAAHGDPGGTSSTTAPSLTMGMPLLADSASEGSLSRYEMPSTARCTCPNWISCSMTGLAVSMGMAKATPALVPAPSEAVLMPISLPSLSMSGPPELPGLIAASVWITPLILRPVGATICRFLPLITPVERDVSCPKGLPMAIANCPTRSLSEVPTVRACRTLSGASIFSTAMSLSGSTPVSLAS